MNSKWIDKAESNTEISAVLIMRRRNRNGRRSVILIYIFNFKVINFMMIDFDTIRLYVSIDNHIGHKKNIPFFYVTLQNELQKTARKQSSYQMFYSNFPILIEMLKRITYLSNGNGLNTLDFVESIWVETFFSSMR